MYNFTWISFRFLYIKNAPLIYFWKNVQINHVKQAFYQNLKHERQNTTVILTLQKHWTPVSDEWANQVGHLQEGDVNEIKLFFTVVI